MLEAVPYILKWAAENLGVNQIIAETQLANIRSVKLLEKGGFQVKGQVERFGETQMIYQINLLDLCGEKT